MVKFILIKSPDEWATTPRWLFTISYSKRAHGIIVKYKYISKVKKIIST